MRPATLASPESFAPPAPPAPPARYPARHAWPGWLVRDARRARHRAVAALLSLAALALSGVAHAESFLGLEPLQSLSSVRLRFPDARLDAERPPWLKDNQYYCMLDTEGADGLVALLFEHDDEKRKQKLADLQKSLPATVNTADNP